MRTEEETRNKLVEMCKEFYDLDDEGRYWISGVIQTLRWSLEEIE